MLTHLSLRLRIFLFFALLALGGAALLLWADVVARTLAPPAELPIGVLTALLGAPFFLWLLRRAAREGTSW